MNPKLLEGTRKLEPIESKLWEDAEWVSQDRDFNKDTRGILADYLDERGLEEDIPLIVALRWCVANKRVVSISSGDDPILYRWYSEAYFKGMYLDNFYYHRDELSEDIFLEVVNNQGGSRESTSACVYPSLVEAYLALGQVLMKREAESQNPTGTNPEKG